VRPGGTVVASAGGSAPCPAHPSPQGETRPREPALALEEVIEEDPGFASRLAAMLEDLSQHPPSGGLAVREAGPSLEAMLSLRSDGTPPGATLTRTARDSPY
jgi:hypothetical protein